MTVIQTDHRIFWGGEKALKRKWFKAFCVSAAISNKLIECGFGVDVMILTLISLLIRRNSYDKLANNKSMAAAMLPIINMATFSNASDNIIISASNIMAMISAVFVSEALSLISDFSNSFNNSFLRWISSSKRRIRFCSSIFALISSYSSFRFSSALAQNDRLYVNNYLSEGAKSQMHLLRLLF